MRSYQGLPRATRLLLGTSIAAILSITVCGIAYAQNDSEGIETITVTGFRASLAKALDLKRQTLEATDSILAEDIAKFPDKNISESLQRIPGVTLQRGTGEGEQITVRGLGPTYTRVRINGIEAMATTTDTENGTNRGRGFDFNVFASELFSQLTVRKSTAASVEEGSLGATVDMYTAHPFDHQGLVYTVSGQAGYQPLAGSANPRVAALVSDTFLGGRLGVLVSAAYSTQVTYFANINSGLWNYGSSSSYDFASVDGATSGPEFNAVNAAYHVRFARYAYELDHIKRGGATSSVQWQPDDKTLFTLDALYANWHEVRDAYSMSGFGMAIAGPGSSVGPGLPVTLGVKSINVLDYNINSHNTLDYMSATNVGMRTESSTNHYDTRFMQLTLDGSREFTDAFKVHVVGGWTESHHRNPIFADVTADYDCTAATSATGTVAGCPGGVAGGAGTAANPYIYDYRNSNQFPQISYGNVDVTSTNGWFLSQIRERAQYVYNSFRTAQADFSYTVASELKVLGGIDYKNYGFNTYETRRSNGTTANQDSIIPTAIQQTPLSDYSLLASVRGTDAPKGTPTAWMAIDLNKADGLFDLWNPTVYNATGFNECANGCGAFHQDIVPGLGNTGTVHENDYGGWIQADWDTTFYKIPFRGNIGVRYVETESKALGYSYNSVSKSLEQNIVSQTYHDWLPAVNMVVEPADDFMIRLNASFAMARPNMMNLVPNASVVGGGGSYNVTIGNPYLKPYRSKNVDLSYEWYYHKGSMLSVAFFYKHLDSFVQTQLSYLPYHGNPYGLSDDLVVAACGSYYGTVCNENLIWGFSKPTNTKGGPLYGTEINWQQAFDFLPHPLDSMGFLGTLTFVQAQQKYFNADGSIYATADPIDLSRTSYSSTLYYDDGTFQARTTGSFRSKRLTSVPSVYGNNLAVTGSSFYVDLSASYKYSDNILFTFDAVNLTDQATYSYIDSMAQRPDTWSKTGPEYYIGIKFTN